MKSLYISRVKIKNFRNFRELDVKMSNKEIIVGENNVGKTNFLRAIQLILDPSLSDEDRMLSESDFNDCIVNPMENDEEILVQIYISNYKKNKTILCTLSDATIIGDDGEEVLLFNYRFFPHIDFSGHKEYEFEIFMGNKHENRFGSKERKVLNFKVIKALRDVERELKNNRNSPIKKLLEQYSIEQNILENIADEYKKCSDKVLHIDEICDLTTKMNDKFTEILGSDDFNLSLQAVDVDPNKILASLKVMFNERSSSDTSLGLNNILYISLILQLLKDNTVPTFLSYNKFSELYSKKEDKILKDCYKQNKNGNYFLDNTINSEKYSILFNYMSNSGYSNQSVTILAIEEPEAHLHPIYQRLIYKDVINKNDSSVLLTTHSTHITSVAPIKSLLHLHHDTHSTIAHSTAEMPVGENEFVDVERYLDVKRGEILLAKGVILVEGIAEEYIIPKLSISMGIDLDAKGIVICNVNCTAFKPYMKLLENLQIPYAVITDGDFYIINATNDDENVEGNEGTRNYHVMEKDAKETDCIGYLGLENAKRIFDSMGKVYNPDIDNKQVLNEQGYFVGKYTFEVDMMEISTSELSKNAFFNTYEVLTNNNITKLNNFKRKFEEKDFEFCLRRIEDKNVGKGRFSQIFSLNCTIDNCPEYVKKAILYLCEKIK